MKGTVKNKWVHGSIIAIFVILYFMVSIISTIHVIDFFKLSNPTWLAISLAVAFEIGAAASLAAIIILEKTSRFMVWSLFLILTVVQAMGNTYYAFINLADFQGWIELFGLVDAELIVQKRILSIVSGAILPIVALGFIKSLVDYIRPEEPNQNTKTKIKDNNLDFLEPLNETFPHSMDDVTEEINKWAEEEDVKEFLEQVDEPKTSSEDDEIHTVGGLTNDKEGSFMKFQDKLENKKPNTNEPTMQDEYYKSKLVKLKDLNSETIEQAEVKETQKPQENTINTNFDSLQQIGKKWIVD
jgi:hypothetical protein|tara:strand:+ start:26 stop:922 length:897 start_codon:yes stop_codon:yes gene_type:complete